MPFTFKLDQNGHPVQIPTLGTARSVAIAVGSTQSAALTANAVRLQPTADCHIAFGADPSATVLAGHFLGAGQQYDIDCNVGDKIATIRVSGDGTLYISELS